MNNPDRHTVVCQCCGQSWEYQIWHHLLDNQYELEVHGHDHELESVSAFDVILSLTEQEMDEFTGATTVTYRLGIEYNLCQDYQSDPDREPDRARAVRRRFAGFQRLPLPAQKR